MTSKTESYVCIRVLVDGEHEKPVHVTSVALCDYEALLEENTRLRNAVETPAECNGKCVGHSSDASTSEWSADPACPLHGSPLKTGAPQS